MSWTYAQAVDADTLKSTASSMYVRLRRSRPNVIRNTSTRDNNRG